jgi:hypothetical protein
MNTAVGILGTESEALPETDVNMSGPPPSAAGSSAEALADAFANDDRYVFFVMLLGLRRALPGYTSKRRAILGATRKRMELRWNMTPQRVLGSLWYV